MFGKKKDELKEKLNEACCQSVDDFMDEGGVCGEHAVERSNALKNMIDAENVREEAKRTKWEKWIPVVCAVLTFIGVGVESYEHYKATTDAAKLDAKSKKDLLDTVIDNENGDRPLERIPTRPSTKQTMADISRPLRK